MNLPRFSPETYADTLAQCQKCDKIMHYSWLDYRGICEGCREDEPEPEPRQEEP